MKISLILLFAFGLTACALERVESQKLANVPANSAANRPDDAKNVKNAVLVELFTSEGCSSCPPAEQTLAFLDREQPYFQAEVVALAFHVDYWNNLGWKDPFSSQAFTERQELYRQKLKLQSSYTPQMIVDGRTEFVGSNDRKAADAILSAAASPKAVIEISKTDKTFKVNLSDIPQHETATVFLAIAENELATAVERGENAGKQLRHRAVVRELKTLGMIEKSSNRGEFTGSFDLSADWKSENLNLVVFCQENESRRILGVRRIAYR